MLIRPLTSAETRLLVAARTNALTHAPYFAHVLFSMRPVAAEGLGTAAVDAAWRLYIDPEILTEWGPHLSGGVLLHEAGHLLREHARRAEALGDPDRNIWNIATDCAINDDLLTANIPLPDGVVTPQNQGLPDHGIEETYYHSLIANTPSNPDDGNADDEGGCGSGAGDRPAPWELPADDTTTAPPTSAHEQATARHSTARAIEEHARTHPGNVPAGLRRWASDHLTGPTVPWRSVLASTIRRQCAALTTGRTTYTYTRPSRRRIPGIITPAMRTPKITAAAVIDTSASMSNDQLTDALAETQGVIKAIGGRLTVITCDADAAHPIHISRANDLTLTGGGGTDMRVGIEAASAANPDVIVVLTDGLTPWPTRPTRARLIIALIGQHTDTSRVPTWATTVHTTT